MKRIAIVAAALLLLAAPVAAQPQQPMMNPQPSDMANYQQAPAAPGVSAIGSPTFVQIHKGGGGGVIEIGQAFGDFLQPYVDAVVNALIVALIGWAFAWFRKKTGIEVDKQQRDALTTFLQNQASSLIADGMVKMEGKKVTVDSAALAKAANEIFTRVPDAAKHFGLTPANVGQAVADRIVDAVPQIAAGAHMIAQSTLQNGNGKLP